MSVIGISETTVMMSEASKLLFHYLPDCFSLYC